MRESIASIAQEFSPVTELDLNAIAKTTKKTLERLAFFCSHAEVSVFIVTLLSCKNIDILTHTSSSGPNPLINNIVGKIGALLELIDSSMYNAHLGVQLASTAMILCDSEEQTQREKLPCRTFVLLHQRGTTSRPLLWRGSVISDRTYVR